MLLASIDDHLASIGTAFREFEGSPVASGDESAVAEAASWLESAAAMLADHRASMQMSDADAEDLAERAERLAGLADDLVEEMDFGFLFDRERGLFSIGYNVMDGRLDRSFYDTLASEARLTSFVAIATGQIPPEHWFKLARSLTPTGSERALLSWSASMFEYFMPLLVMRAYPGTLLDETYRAVIARQKDYAATRKVPWGISESAYYAQDLDRNYQYRAFGVPGLGLKRGLIDDLVIAPYASILAAPLVAGDVLRNLERLRQFGMSGKYGFYEAIDFTPARVPAKEGRGVVLRTFMAHHQGMSLVALDNALHDDPMQRRFHDDPRVQSADLLLQERIPHQVPLKNPPIELVDRVPSARDAADTATRVYTTPHTLSPRCHMISNGSYVVMVSSAGGGYSQRQQTALTRWREDITTDSWGQFCYVRDLETNRFWSTAYLPTAHEPDEYECTFAPDRAVFRRVDGSIETRTEIVVSPDDDAELRRVSVTNLGTTPRRLDLTSYAEVVLASGDADLSHPAFSNLFIETRLVQGRDARHRLAPAAVRQRAQVPRPPAQRPRPRRAGRAVRNRSCEIHRPRAHARSPARDVSASALEHGRSSARPDRQSAARRAACAWRDRPADVHDRLRRERSRRARDDRQIRRPARHRARDCARGRPRADRASAPGLDHGGHLCLPAPRRPAPGR